MALNIPVEICLLIASYVDKENYDKLIDVNSVFFNIIMDKRYREVQIGYIDDKDFMRRKLVRLCDPFVAPRVRRLHVDPHFNTCADLQYWKEAKRDNGGFTQSPMQSLLAAVKYMSNVTEFTIYWPDPAATEFKPFLPTAWNSFGPRLTSLTLLMSFPGAERLMVSLMAAAPAIRLVALEELCLEFGRGRHLSRWETMDLIYVRRIIAPFINRLAPQLRQLSISSRSEELDPCLLLSALDPSFPALHHFSIRAPFRQTWSNALASFLRHNSKTIHSVDLIFIPATISDLDIFHRSVYYSRNDEGLASWLKALSNDPVVFSGLHSLKIYPTYSSQAGFNTAVSLIRRSAETLTSLNVPVRFLTHEEVTTIVSIFSTNRSIDSCHLVTLRLNLRRLDPPIIHLLATNLPGLKELGLCLMNPQNAFAKTYEITASNMQGHFYPDWELYDLGIWGGYGKVDEVVLRLIAKAVPSIKSFWGESRFPHQTNAYASQVYPRTFSRYSLYDQPE